MKRLPCYFRDSTRSGAGHASDGGRTTGRKVSPVLARRIGTGRGGLSLMEVLIALALSMLLLSSVYTAINLYYLQSSAGHEEIEKNQLARVLLQRIEQDLRSISYREGSTTTAETGVSGDSTGGESESGGTGTTGTDTTTTEMQVTSPADAFSGSDSGLFGDMQTLVLHVSRPNKEIGSIQQLTEQAAGQRTSDLKTVAFFVAGSGSGGLQAVAAAQFAAQSKAGNLQTRGLARMEGERLALQLADKQGSVGSLLGQTQLLAPEVSGISFRYYDGTNWQTQWDSASYGGLPRAVEVTLEMTFEAKTTGRGRFKKTKQEAPRTFRSVVPLPLSKPILTPTSTSY